MRQHCPVNELYPSSQRLYLPLSGTWEFQLDPKDAGLAQGWQQADAADWEDQIQVPGCLEAQGKGLEQHAIVAERPPTWDDNRADEAWQGVCWYRRRFTLPEGTAGKRLCLRFGGVSHSARIWLNGSPCGSQEIAAAAFAIDITDLVRGDGDQVLTLRLETRKHHPVGLGVTTGFIPWQGIYRDVELVACPQDHLADLELGYDGTTLQATVDLAGQTRPTDRLQLVVMDSDGAEIASTEAAATEPVLRLPVPEVRPWSDHDPVLYRVGLRWLRDGAVHDSRWLRYGFRTIAVRDDGQILLNDEPIYLRGEMYHMHWPNTISPQTDRDDLRAKLQTYVESGFNFLRCHTHAPHPEFLEVCDELGIVVHSEFAIFSRLFKVPEEYGLDLIRAVVPRDRHHPCLLIWCLGNEINPHQDKHQAFFAECLAEVRAHDASNRLIQDNSPGSFLFPDGREIRAAILHEYGKWASFPDPTSIPAYRGAIRPWVIQYAQERLHEAGLGDLIDRCVANSQALQSRCRKLGIEDQRGRDRYQESSYGRKAKRKSYGTGPLIGYEFCTVRDTIQFMWGLMDDHSRRKEAAPLVRRYNDDTVLVLQLPDWHQRIHLDGASLPIRLRLSHFGTEQIDHANLHVILEDDHGTVHHELSVPVQIDRGALATVHEQDWQLPVLKRPTRFHLRARLDQDDTCITSNDWALWSFPPPQAIGSAAGVRLGAQPFIGRDLLAELITPQAEAAVLVTADWQGEGRAHAEAGGVTVLLPTAIAQAAWDEAHIEHAFPAFPSEWQAGRAENAYRGSILFPHPVFDHMPHAGWADLPFEKMINGCMDEQALGTIWVKHANTLLVGTGLVLRMDQIPELVDPEPLLLAIPGGRDPAPERAAWLFTAGCGDGRVVASSLACHREDPAGAWLLAELVRSSAVLAGASGD